MLIESDPEFRRLVVDTQLRYQREFLDSLASFGPNAYTTALALHNWARQAARDNKDQLRWIVQRQ